MAAPLAIGGYYGFTDIRFDTIEMAAISTGGDIRFTLIDKLQFLAAEEIPGVINTPVPAAFWLFGTALIGFIGFSRRTNI